MAFLVFFVCFCFVFKCSVPKDFNSGSSAGDWPHKSPLVLGEYCHFLLTASDNLFEVVLIKGSKGGGDGHCCAVVAVPIADCSGENIFLNRK